MTLDVIWGTPILVNLHMVDHNLGYVMVHGK